MENKTETIQQQEVEVEDVRPVYRMYSLVVRQLSTMQKGVQTAHAVTNYALYHHDEEDWKQWASTDETLIVLDGGTCPEMESIEYALGRNGVTHEIFFEPDLNDMETAICFLAPEQVWDRETYPDFNTWCDQNEYNCDGSTPSPYSLWVDFMGGPKNVFLRDLLSTKRLAQ